MDNNRRDLVKRQMLIGAQACYAHDMLWISLVGLFTSHTAIARIRDDNGFVAEMLFVLLLISAIALIVEFAASVSDIYLDTSYTKKRFFQSIARYRHYFYIVGAVWHLVLMSTVQAENGIGSVVAYGSLFIVGSMIGMVLAVRDGCISNRQQHRALQIKQKG